MEAVGRPLKRIWYLIYLVSTSIVLAAGDAKAQTQALAATGETFDVIIGTMCIGDLPGSARTYTGQVQQGSDFFRKWSVVWPAQSPPAPVAKQGSKAPPVSKSAANKSAAAKSAAGAVKSKTAAITPQHPIIRFFRSVPTGGLGSTCRDLKGDVVLSGEIDRIRLNATSSVYEPGKPAFLRIDPEGLSVTVGHVQSGLATLFGGSIDLAGSKAWIEHSEQLINIEGQPPQGSIEITSWARRLKGAKLVLQDGAPPKSFDMSSLRENVTIKVPLTGATTELLVGGFTGSPSEIALDKFVLPVVTFEKPSLDIGTVTVERDRKDTSLTLLRTSVRYQTVAAMSQRTTLSLTSAGLSTIDRLASGTSPSGAVMLLHSVTLEGLFAKGSQCASQVANTSFVKAGVCALKVSKADDRTGQFDVSTEDVQSVAFSFVFAPVAATTVAYSINRTGDNETFGGRVTPYVAHIGRLAFDQLQDLIFTPSTITGPAIKIPVSVSIANAGGSLSFANQQGKASVQGTLSRFKLGATFVISPADPSPWSLNISKGDLTFAGSALVALEPVLYGGKPDFVGLGISFGALSDLNINSHASIGLVQFTPDLTTVLDPTISLGRSSEGVVFKAPARLDAKATLSVNISNGAINVENGQLTIDDAKAVVEPNHPATLGDVKVEDGSAQFGHLQAVFTNGLGKIEVDSFQATAQRLSSVPSSEGGQVADQISWSGRAADVLKSDVIAADVGRNPDNSKRLKFEHVVVKNTCVKLADADIGNGGALKAHGKSLQVCVDIWSDAEMKGKLEFRDGAITAETGDAEGSIGIPSIGIHVTSGTPAQPNGDAQVVTANLSIAAKTNIPLTLRCKGLPDFQPINGSTDVSAPVAIVVATMTGGVLKGSGGVAFLKGHFHNTSQYDCTGEILDWKLWNAVKIKTYVWCPTWKQPGRTCMKEITIIPEGRVTIDSRTKVYSLTADANATNPRFAINREGGKTKVKACAGSFVQATPLIAVSYTFQPRTPVPGFDRFIGDLTGYIAAPFESALLTVIANFLTSIATLVDFVAPETFCTN
jgi:hypothetical protein